MPKLRPLPYALAAVAAGLAQHVLLFLMLGGLTFDTRMHAEGFINLLNHAPQQTVLLSVLLFVAGGAAQALLAALRVHDAKGAAWTRWTIGVALIPVLQVPVILTLISLPSANAPSPTRPPVIGDLPLALAASVGGSILSIVLGALVFGGYGWVLFLVSPVLIGYATGLIANRTNNIGWGSTFGIVSLGLVLGALALLAIALEGLICLIMASPLVLILGGLGGEGGRRMAERVRTGAETAFSTLAILPLIFAMEQLAPSTTAFTTQDRLFIAAPPAAVWQALTQLEPITERPAFPLNLGIGYPLGATWDGQGPGAIRRSTFSTGVVVERVTDWRPGESLQLTLLNQPPAMRELSPYGRVFAPHVQGYFRHVSSHFEMTPAPGGTWLTLSGRNEMDLAPGPYWRPIARYVLHAVARRGMEHIRTQAEAAEIARGEASRQGSGHGGDSQILPEL